MEASKFQLVLNCQFNINYLNSKVNNMKNNIQSKNKLQSESSYQFLVKNYPQLIPLADELKKRIEISVLKATGHILEPDQYATPNVDTLEHILIGRLHKISSTKKEFASINFYARRKTLELKTLNLKFKKRNASILEYLQNNKSAFELNHLSNVSAMKKPSITYFETKGVNDGFYTGFHPNYDKLGLRIHNLHCIDETNGFFGAESNGDEIALSAIILETETVKHTLSDGSINNIPYKNVFQKPITLIGNGIGDGRIITPTPSPWYYHTFNIWNPSGNDGLPKYRSCQFILSELDNGGFNDFMESAFNKIAEVVTGEIVRQITVEAIKYVVLPALGAYIGAGVGAIVGFLAGHLITLLVEIWEDDILHGPPASVIIPGFDPFLGPNRNEFFSEILYLQFEGAGGRYQIDYSWQLMASEHQQYPSFTGPGYVNKDETSKGATIFTDVLFSGHGKFLKKGSYILKKDFVIRYDTSPQDFLGTYDENIDSIKIDSGIAVFAYKTPDFSDIPLILTSDVKWFDDSWRDSISSIKVVDISNLVR